MTPRVPAPAPRKARPLPWVAMGLASVVGLVAFVLLWQVAVELQAQQLPTPKGGAWQEQPPAP